MPSGELNEYLEQIPHVLHLITGNEVRTSEPDDD